MKSVYCMYLASNIFILVVYFNLGLEFDLITEVCSIRMIFLFVVSCVNSGKQSHFSDDKKVDNSALIIIIPHQFIKIYNYF